MNPRAIIPIAIALIANVCAQISLGPSNEISDYDFYPTNTTVVDLDGDGDMDVLAQEEYGSRVFWFLNDGAGGFHDQGEWLPPQNVNWRNVGFLDYDQDGFLDLVALFTNRELNADTLCYLQGDPEGGFKSDYEVILEYRDEINITLNPSDFDPIDLDGDGRKDVILEDHFILLGKNPAQVIRHNINIANSHQLAGRYFIDWDLDGLPDVLELFGWLLDPDFTVKINQGDGTFSEALAVFNGNHGNSPKVHLIKNDLDSESLDFLVSDEIGGVPQFSIISRASNTEAEIAGSWRQDEFAPEGLIPGWVQSNQKGFVVMTNRYPRELLLKQVETSRLTWDGTSLTASPFITEVPNFFLGNIDQIAEVDLDGNSIPDTLVAVQGPDRVVGGPGNEIFWIKDGASGPSDTLRNPISQPSRGQRVLMASDFNNDEQIDLVTLQIEPLIRQGQLVIWTNSNNGESFIPEVVPGGGGFTTVVRVFDLDERIRLLGEQFQDATWEEGHQGILAFREVPTGTPGSSTQVTLTFILQNSQGGFDFIDQGSFEDFFPVTVHTGDFNGDGVIDLIYSSSLYSAESLKIYLQWGIPGSLGFEPPTLILEDWVLGAWAPADFDGDGDLDFQIYQLDERNYEVENWLKNEPEGLFQREIDEDGYQPIYNYIPTPNLIDLDSDGDLDLVSPIPTNRLSGYNRIGWFENKGTILAAPESILDWVPIEPLQARWANRNSYLMADLDHDGTKELVIGSTGFERFEWFEVIQGEQPPAYRAWADQSAITGHSSAPNANWDGDALTNWEEFAFGSDPKRQDDSHPGRPGITVTPKGPKFTFHRHINAKDIGINYRFLRSDDLTDWTHWAPSRLTIEPLNAEYEKVSIPLSHARSFFRRVPIRGNGEE